MKMYHVDAFTDRLFAGNPAAVCLMDRFPADAVMQNIASENRLSETAYLVPDGEDRYRLRWFTPGGEIDLCGHATLASGFVVLNYCRHQSSTIHFTTKSGELTVSAVDGHYQMSFPSYELKEVPVSDAMTAAFGVKTGRRLPRPGSPLCIANCGCCSKLSPGRRPPCQIAGAPPKYHGSQ